MPEGPAPRLFGVAPGVDFPRALVDGLVHRFGGPAPDALARVTVIVNTQRMRRRLLELFDAGPARLLPAIRVLTEIGTDPLLTQAPAPVPRLRRRLELARLVARLLDEVPDLAPRASLFDLAESLAALMDEMQSEGVTPSRLAALDVSDTSGHWQRSLAFLRVLAPYFDAASGDAPDAEARQRRAIEALCARWAEDPPDRPFVVAGSTGSRGATAMLMSAVARLPQGAVVLPGFDFDLPGPIWQTLDDPMTGEEHPQFRFAHLFGLLGCGPDRVRPWSAAPPPSAGRNRLVSLALRPAPVTDQWMTEGRALGDIATATADLALIEAPSPRIEAGAIAVALREGLEQGLSCALITPDRTLARRVAAALDRWGIVPDDSAGRPLSLSPPGRLLRQTARLLAEPLTGDALVALLKHPLTASGSADRGRHLLLTREYELSLRRWGPPYPDADALARWAAAPAAPAGATDWAGWLGALLPAPSADAQPLDTHLARHLALAGTLAAGPGAAGSGALWEEEAGVAARAAVDSIAEAAPAAGPLTAWDYVRLIDQVLGAGEVREDRPVHGAVTIWGTLEARVQGADLVILGGLNEGTWPALGSPDPWLSRQMRKEAGLLLPERRIGLAAHDFQQAVCAPRVILARSVRGDEAETVPSRWLIRLTNLLGGLDADSGAALAGMRARGGRLVALASALELPGAPVAPAARPAPAPPPDARPASLPITRIETLIRDPYAVYARYVLGLYPLDPLRRPAGAAERGNLIHAVLEELVRDGVDADPAAIRARLMQIADARLARDIPWPAVRRLWRMRLAAAAEPFAEQEAERQRLGVAVAQEAKASLFLPDPGFTLTGKIDRVDRLNDGGYAVYDYKTGTIPSEKQMQSFNKQLALSALVVERGAVAGVPPGPVSKVAHVEIGSTSREHDLTLDPPPAEVERELVRLVLAWRDEARGYVSQRAMFDLQTVGDYAHLARFGEWEITDPAQVTKVGR